jgi:hypothetical protein
LTGKPRVREDLLRPPVRGGRDKRGIMRRKIVALVAVGALALSAAGPAAAFHCFVVNKPVGAGSAATVTFDVLTSDEPDFDSLPVNPNSGRVQGGFVTLRIVAGALELGTWDLLFQTTVGGQAHASGPAGANECDGVGIDDLLACLGIEE